MSDVDYLSLACQHLGVDASDVVASAVVDIRQEVVLIVDYGIKGSKKYAVPFDDLQPAEIGHESSVEEPETISLAGYSYRELQAMAKDKDIPANQSADDLRAALLAELDN